MGSTQQVIAKETERSLPLVRPLPWRTGIWVTVAALAWIAMGELDRLSSGVPDTLGRVFGFGDLMGLTASADSWLALTDSPIASTIGWWLLCYLILDLILVVCYFRFGRWLSRYWPWPGRWIVYLAAVDVFEDAWAVVVALLLIAGAGAPSLVADLLVILTWFKFGLLALVILASIRQLVRRRKDEDARERDRSLWLGAYAQRFSLLTVLPVAVLSVVPGADILDQLPDVQRQWAESPLAAARGLVAAGALLVLAGGLFLLGRLRSDYVSAKRTDLTKQQEQVITRPNLSHSRLDLWMLPAAVLLGFALVAMLVGAGRIHWPSLIIFAAVPAAIGIASWLIRWLRFPVELAPQKPDPRPGRLDSLRASLRGLDPPPKRASTYADFAVVCLIGDLAATATLVIGGLGLVRSFVAPAALADLPGIQFQARYLVALGLGAAVAIAVWPAAAWAMRRVTLDEPPPRGANRVRSTLTPGAANAIGPGAHSWVAAFSVALLVLVALIPQPLAQAGGVTAATLLSIAALSLLIGSLVVLAQSRYSPELFWLPGLRLPSAPLASLLVAAVLLTAGTRVDIDVHPVRGAVVGSQATAAALPKRPEPKQALQGWLSATSGCGHRVTVNGRSVILRPMPLVAAEGGGIRAAYWTAAGLDLLSKRASIGEGLVWQPAVAIDRCRSALLSGGASGGAVGLTVSRFADEISARDQVVEMSRSDALAKAVVGLFIRDTFYAATGVPMPALPDSPTWSDRAALMERSWEAAAPALAQPFVPVDPAGATAHPPGMLVLNSTSVATGCRMLVSQLALKNLGAPNAEPTGTDPNVTVAANEPARAVCDETSRPAPNSLDWVAAYSGAAATANGAPSAEEPADGSGGISSGPAGTDCLDGLQASTAAMLASRFPYVTPSGVIGPCGKWPRQQFVDGGYVENTGIGTIIDLSPWWLEQVRHRNDLELSRPGEIELIIPYVVYLDNGTGSDLAAPTYENTSEFLVPPLTILRAGGAQAAPAALLQQAALLVEANRLWDPNPVDQRSAGFTTALTAELTKWRPRPVIVIHQSTVPAVTAPLGWTLSDLSIATMDRSLVEQSGLDCTRSSDLLCRRGYGSLADADRLYAR